MTLRLTPSLSALRKAFSRTVIFAYLPERNQRDEMQVE